MMQENMEEELIRELEGRAEDEMNPSYAAEQALGQARRYFNGAQKQIEGLKKLSITAYGKGLLL